MKVSMITTKILMKQIIYENLSKVPLKCVWDSINLQSWVTVLKKM